MIKKIGIGLIIAVLLVFLFPLKANALNPELFKFKLPASLFATPSPSPTPEPSPSPEVSPSPSPELTPSPTPAVEEEEEVIEEEVEEEVVEETPSPSPSPSPQVLSGNIWQLSTIALGAAVIGGAIAFLLGRKKEKKGKKKEED